MLACDEGLLDGQLIGASFIFAAGPSREAQLAPLAAVQEPAAAEEPSSQPIAAPEQPGSVPLPPSKATAAAPLQPILRLPLRPDPNARLGSLVWQTIGLYQALLSA